MSPRPLTAVLLATTATILISCGGGRAPDRAASTEAPRAAELPRPVASEEMQAKRKAQIQELVNRGLFRRIKGNTVTVDLPFYALDFADKELYVALVAAYHYELPSDGTLTESESVYLVDAKTGKSIGHFGTRGLVLY
jgi:hypothetical protein